MGITYVWRMINKRIKDQFSDGDINYLQKNIFL